MYEVEVLANDLRTRSGEVQSVRLLRPSKVVKFKDQMLRKVRLVAPNDPPDSGVH